MFEKLYNEKTRGQKNVTLTVTSWPYISFNVSDLLTRRVGREGLG